MVMRSESATYTDTGLRAALVNHNITLHPEGIPLYHVTEVEDDGIPAVYITLGGWPIYIHMANRRTGERHVVTETKLPIDPRLTETLYQRGFLLAGYTVVSRTFGDELCRAIPCAVKLYDRVEGQGDGLLFEPVDGGGLVRTFTGVTWKIPDVGNLTDALRVIWYDSVRIERVSGGGTLADLYRESLPHERQIFNVYRYPELPGYTVTLEIRATLARVVDSRGMNVGALALPHPAYGYDILTIAQHIVENPTPNDHIIDLML